jgi:hypothetical protein
MTDFDALLKRSFAEAHEPADDGFSLNVGRAVAKREASLKTRSYIQYGAIGIGAAAVTWGLYSLAGVFGQDLLGAVGLEAARAQSALTTAQDVSAEAQGFLQSMGAGLTQILLATAALAGGAVAYRASQD